MIMGCTLCDVKKTVKSNVKKNLQRTVKQKVVSRVIFEKMKHLGKAMPKSDLRESDKKKKKTDSNPKAKQDDLFQRMVEAKSDEEMDGILRENIKNDYPDWDDATIDFLVGDQP